MKKINLAYADLYNAGDLMNKDIVEKISNMKVVRSKTFRADMIAIGGALIGLQYDKNVKKRFAQKFLRIFYKNKPIYVWGSGFFNDFNDNEFYRDNIKVCALRGKKTQEKLEKITGKNYSNILLADAGLLIDLLIDKNKEYQKKYSIGLIPHMWHQEEKAFKEMANKNGVHVINIKQPPQQVAEEILQCETIVSSSLHGLVFADALNIPNMHILGEKELKGGNFKFEDYYSSFDLLDKPCVLSKHIPSKEEILENYKIDYKDVEKKKEALIEAFPKF